MFDRRTLLGAGAAASALLVSGRAGAQIILDRSAERYGMIEIGSSGVKVNAYRFTRQVVLDDEAKGPSGRERFAPSQVAKGYTVNTTVVNGTPKDIDDTVEAVAAALQRLTAPEDPRQPGLNFNVPRSNIKIVASSGVASFPAILETLSAKITSRTQFTLDSVTPAEEARLSFDWVVLSHRRQQVLLVDIGSGNTKGGYYEQVGTPQQRFRDFSVPLGTKTFANAIRKAWPTDPVLLRARSIFDEQYLPLLNDQIGSAPGLLNKPRVYFSGGIFWATAIMTRPTQMAQRQNWVRLRAQDFEVLGQMIKDGDPYALARKAVLPQDQATYLANQITATTETFNPDQLAAGNALCRALSARMSFETRSALFFASFAVDAWSSQYLVEKFRAETLDA